MFHQVVLQLDCNHRSRPDQDDSLESTVVGQLWVKRLHEMGQSMHKSATMCVVAMRETDINYGFAPSRQLLTINPYHHPQYSCHLRGIIYSWCVLNPSYCASTVFRFHTPVLLIFILIIILLLWFLFYFSLFHVSSRLRSCTTSLHDCRLYHNSTSTTLFANFYIQSYNWLGRMILLTTTRHAWITASCWLSLRSSLGSKRKRKKQFQVHTRSAKKLTMRCWWRSRSRRRNNGRQCVNKV